MKLVIFRDSSIGRLRMERSHPLGTWSVTLPPGLSQASAPIQCRGSRDQCIAMVERQYTASPQSATTTGEDK